MNQAEARAAIRASTNQDVVGQVTEAQLDVWMDLEHKALRRKLQLIAPTLYTAVDTAQVITSASPALTLPSDFESLVRIERQVGDDWEPVEITDGLNPHISDLNVREEGGTSLKLAPAALAAGTYRIVYVQKPTVLTLTGSGNGSTLAVPQGLEDVILELVCARVRVRFDEDPSPHYARAGQVWAEQKPALRRRYGASPEPGLRLVRRW